MPTTNIKITATDKSKNAFNSAKRNVDALKGSVTLLKGALLGYVSVASAKAFVNFTSQQRDMADVIGKMSTRLNISTQALQEFRYAGELSGESIEAMDNNVVKFVRNVGDARNGVTTLTDEFERLNIDLKSADGTWKGHVELLNEVADAYKNTDDPARKLSSAMTLFGRGGRVMVNMLSDGSEGLNKFGKQLRQTGAIISDEFVRSSEEANDRLTWMGKILDAHSTQKLQWFNEAILDVTDSFLRFKGVDPTATMSLERLRQKGAELESQISKTANQQRAWNNNAGVTQEVRDREVKQLAQVIYNLDKEHNLILARIRDIKALDKQKEISIKRSEVIVKKEIENSRKVETQEQQTNHMRVRNSVKSLDTIEQETKAHTLRQSILAQQVIALRRTDEEQVTAKIMEEHRIRLGVIKQYLKSRGIAESQNNALIVEQKRRTAEQLAEIDIQKRDSAISTTKEMIRSMGSANKSWFQANKALAIADTIMATYTGASKALSIPPPWVGMAYSATILGLGMANVNRIRQTKYEARAMGGEVKAGQTYLVGEQGRELFTPNQSGNITPNHELGTTVNFNINTNDARGFDDLLQDRRGMIVSMINRASNENGRGDLI